VSASRLQCRWVQGARYGQLLEVKNLDHGVQTTTRLTVETDAGGKPVAIADVVTRFLR